ncbi:hypothetical protein HDU96_003635, partial [Phlyctochytrium bullatum]
MGSSIYLIALLTLLIALVPPTPAQNTTVIPIGVILPFDSVGFNVSVRRVLDLTEWDLNNDPAYRIPNATFRLVWTDSRSSLATTVGSAIRLANEGVVGILGEFSSGRSGPMALAMNSFGVYQCAVSSNPGLSDKSQYNFFFRTAHTHNSQVPSDKYQAYGMVRLVKYFGWNRVALVTVNAAYGFGLSANFLDLASQVNLTVLRNEAYNADDTDFRIQVKSLKDVDARIIVLMAYDVDVIYLLREARKQGMIGPNYVWIASDAVEPMYEMLFGETRSQWTDEDRANVESIIYSTESELGEAQHDSLNTRYAQRYNG